MGNQSQEKESAKDWTKGYAEGKAPTPDYKQLQKTMNWLASKVPKPITEVTNAFSNLAARIGSLNQDTRRELTEMKKDYDRGIWKNIHKYTDAIDGLPPIKTTEGWSPRGTYPKRPAFQSIPANQAKGKTYHLKNDRVDRDYTQLTAEQSQGFVEDTQFSIYNRQSSTPMPDGPVRSDGEPMDDRAPSVAHPTIAKGSLVAIINQDNGMMTTAFVLDRGPYVADKDRRLDINPYVARELGFRGTIPKGLTPEESRQYRESDEYLSSIRGIGNARIVVLWVPGQSEKPPPEWLPRRGKFKIDNLKESQARSKRQRPPNPLDWKRPPKKQAHDYFEGFGPKY